MGWIWGAKIGSKTSLKLVQIWLKHVLFVGFLFFEVLELSGCLLGAFLGLGLPKAPLGGFWTPKTRKIIKDFSRFLENRGRSGTQGPGLGPKGGPKMVPKVVQKLQKSILKIVPKMTQNDPKMGSESRKVQRDPGAKRE
jgi:hypothetical protein